MTRANTEQLKYTPWFAKAGAACSIVPIARFVNDRIFALKGGGYAAWLAVHEPFTCSPTDCQSPHPHRRDGPRTGDPIQRPQLQSPRGRSPHLSDRLGQLPLHDQPGRNRQEIQIGWEWMCIVAHCQKTRLDRVTNHPKNSSHPANSWHVLSIFRDCPGTILDTM